ncbi:DUF2586 family protein [Reichenbachiella sp.]|uniref:DUF2586 family protein n=1 Tax=Reichenbachiella sp. TaxID=2184521 RepID=UPI003B5CFD37
MSTKGVIISKEKPAVGVTLGDRRISGLIANAVAVASTFALNKLYKINSVKDAEDILGIDDAYDVANSVVLYHHIVEFYEEVGLDSGVDFYLYGVAQSTTMEEMVDVAGTIGKGLINGANGDAFQIGIARNPTLPFVPTIVDGVWEEVMDAIPKAQALVDWAFGKMFPTRIVLEGKYFTPPVSGAQNLRDITNVKAPNVSVVVGQDWDFAESDAAFNNYAAVGTCLGTIAAAEINENIGWVDEFNLTDVAAERWETAGLSNHGYVEDYQEDWELLDSKGYIFPQTYPRVDGYRWNNDHTCTPIEVDVEGNMNEAYQMFGRTMDSMAMSAYGALIGRVKSPQPVNPTTGKLPTVVVADFKAIAEKRIDQDLDGKISGREVIIDKDSNLLPPTSQLDMAVKGVPYGSTSTIKVKIGLVKQL